MEKAYNYRQSDLWIYLFLRCVWWNVWLCSRKYTFNDEMTKNDWNKKKRSVLIWWSVFWGLRIGDIKWFHRHKSWAWNSRFVRNGRETKIKRHRPYTKNCARLEFDSEWAATAVAAAAEHFSFSLCVREWPQNQLRDSVLGDFVNELKKKKNKTLTKTAFELG